MDILICFLSLKKIRHFRFTFLAYKILEIVTYLALKMLGDLEHLESRIGDNISDYWLSPKQEFSYQGNNKTSTLFIFRCTTCLAFLCFDLVERSWDINFPSPLIHFNYKQESFRIPTFVSSVLTTFKDTSFRICSNSITQKNIGT